MPKAVSNWILTCRFEGNQHAYFVLTCGRSVGNAAAYAKKLCAEKKLQFRGLALVVMPNNYVALSNIPDKEECAAIMEKAGVRLSSLSALVKKGELFPKTEISLKDRMSSVPICSLFNTLFVHNKGFVVADGCTFCGKCAQRCPLNNISLKDTKPVWHGNCMHCMAYMACIGGAVPQRKLNTKRPLREIQILHHGGIVTECLI